MSFHLMVERIFVNLSRTSTTASCRSYSSSLCDDLHNGFALKQKAETIHNILGLRLGKARALLKKERALAQKPLTHYSKICEVVDPFKPITGHEYQNMQLLLSSATLVHRNCQFLRECGVTKTSSDVISGCQNFMTVPIGVFKSYVNLDHSVDIEQKWLSLFQHPLLVKETKKYLEDRGSPWKTTIAQMRNVVFASYTAHKWNMPFEDIFQWVEEGIKSLPFSVSRLMRVLDVLEEIGCDQAKMWSNPKLLRSDPESLRQFVQTYKDDFLGQNATQFLRENVPVTYQIDFATLHTNVDTLQRFGVPAACIRENLKDVLVKDSGMLQEKLRQMEPYPELGVFVHHPKFAKLLDDVDTVVLRVKTFRAIDKRQITFSACTCSVKEFSALIQQRAQFRISDESLAYLSDQTGQPIATVKDALKLHPNSKLLSLDNMKRVVELIISEGFSKEQLLNGIHLVLYPAELVAQKLAELSKRPDMQPIEVSLKEPNILQMVLYLLEENFMFTGNGVFAENTAEPIKLPTPRKGKSRK